MSCLKRNVFGLCYVQSYELNLKRPNIFRDFFREGVKDSKRAFFCYHARKKNITRVVAKKWSCKGRREDEMKDSLRQADLFIILYYAYTFFGEKFAEVEIIM